MADSLEAYTHLSGAPGDHAGRNETGARKRRSQIVVARSATLIADEPTEGERRARAATGPSARPPVPGTRTTAGRSGERGIRRPRADVCFVQSVLEVGVGDEGHSACELDLSL